MTIMVMDEERMIILKSQDIRYVCAPIYLLDFSKGNVICKHLQQFES